MAPEASATAASRTGNPEFRSQFARRAERSGGRCAGVLSTFNGPLHRPIACFPQGSVGQAHSGRPTSESSRGGPAGYVSALAGMIAHPMDRAAGRMTGNLKTMLGDIAHIFHRSIHCCPDAPGELTDEMEATARRGHGGLR